MPSEPTVGREPELELIRACVGAVGRGERRLLVVRGEAGIGKSRMLDVLGEHAAGAGFVVLRGRSTELESDVPLAPVFEALGADSGDALLPVQPRSWESPATRWRLYRAIGSHLDDLAARGAIALILDDIHWADQSTVEFIEHSIRRPPHRPHLLVVALRPGKVVDRLLAASSATGGRGVSMDLAPLDRAAAELLLGSVATPADRERILRDSGGNPLLLEELARVGVDDGIPHELAAAVRIELDSLPAGARELLRAGALLGDPFDVDLAGTVAGLDVREALDALDELAGREFLRGTPTPRRFAFRHPVIRSAVYTGLPAGARLAGHATAARVLASAGSALPIQARHLVHAARTGDIDAAAVLRSAAVDVRPQAPSTAADWLLAAQRADPVVDADNLSTLAETLIDAGRLPEALTIVNDALAALAHRGIEPPVRLVLVGASVERLSGRHNAALRRLTRALRERSEHGPAAARLMAELALSCYESGKLDDMADWAERARNHETDDALAHAAAAAMLGAGYVFSGRFDAADAEVRLAVKLVDEATDDELAARAELLTAVPWALLALERLPEALNTGRRIAEAARRGGNGSAAVALDLAVVLSLGLLGRCTESAEAADLAEQAARVTGNDQTVQWALWMRAWALLERGDVRSSLAVAEESVAMATQLDDSGLVTVARAVHGAALVASKQPALGRPLLAGYGLDPGWVCRWAPVLVEAELALGDLDAAKAVAARASDLAARIRLSGPRAAAARAEALVALAAGDASSAFTLATRAITDADFIGAQLESARAHLIAGRALGTGDRPSAVNHLRTARRRAAECGAQRVDDEAVRELRRLGQRIGAGGPRAGGIGPLASLSPREREIADLVGAGLTNKEIAGQMFLSEKTVESHLSRTFTKLGVRSRAALATRVAEAADTA